MENLKLIARLFNGELVYRHEFDLSEKDIDIVLSVLPEEKRKEKKEKINNLVVSLPEKTNEVSFPEEVILKTCERIQVLLSGKGSKYLEDWGDLSKEKLIFMGCSDKLLAEVVAALAGKKRKTRTKSSNKQLTKICDAILLPFHNQIKWNKYIGELVDLYKQGTNESIVKCRGKMISVPNDIIFTDDNYETAAARVKLLKKKIRRQKGEVSTYDQQTKIIERAEARMRKIAGSTSFQKNGRIPNVPQVFTESNKRIWTTECEGS